MAVMSADGEARLGWIIGGAGCSVASRKGNPGIAECIVQEHFE